MHIPCRCAHDHIRMHTCVQGYTLVDKMDVHIYIHINKQVYIYVLYVSMYIYMYIYIYVCICLYVYMYIVCMISGTSQALLLFHPDKAGGDAERFRAVQEAWEMVGTAAWQPTERPEVYVGVHTYTYIYVYMYIYFCVYVYRYIGIYIYTTFTYIRV